MTDREEVLALVRQEGSSLCYASWELQNDKAIVLAAVRQNPHALEYASGEFKGDREIVLAAVRQIDSDNTFLCNFKWLTARRVVLFVII